MALRAETVSALTFRRLAWILGIQIVVLAALGVVALDLYAHKHLENVGGVNMWGYRGPVAHAKRPREVRIAVVGGTRAFGWGLTASGTAASSMNTRMMLVIDRPGTEPPPLVILNLGRPGDRVADYPATIAHYAPLQPDFICLYDDLGAGDVRPTWIDSGVFALTGYMPMLPLALHEKGLALRFGSVIQGYAGTPVSPGPSAFARAAGTLLEGAGDVLASIDRGIARAAAAGHRPAPPAAATAPYAAQLQKAIDAAHQHARGVVIVVGPAESSEQRENRAAVESIKARCATNRWCRFVDLGGITKLLDPDLRVDGWNYGGDATWAVAEAISPAALDLMGFR
jgi:hypothetical protein